MSSSRLSAVVSSLRPKQWIKNVFVLAPLVFAHGLDDPDAVVRALLAFAVFCALSSCVYLWNDIADREIDRLHPHKRNRPIASGALGPRPALALSMALAVAALGVAWGVEPGLAVVGLGYLLISLLYSVGLKRVVILDVMLVAAGFLLRALAGSVAIGVALSDWLVLCTGLIALFLGFVKRRQEITVLQGATGQRPALREYSLPFLDQMIGVVTASTVLAYALYALSPEVAEKLGTQWMGLTIPFVLFGIFRYLYLVHLQGEGDNPTALVLSDRPLLLNFLLWGATVLVVLYVL